MLNSYRRKPLAIVMYYILPEFYSSFSQSRKPNVKISIVFFFSFKRKWKTVWCMWTINTPIDSSTTRDVSFFGYSCVWAKISDFWLQTLVAVSFLYAFLCMHAQVDN